MYLAPLSTFGLQKTLLKQLLDHIVVLAKPKRIILYGSRARGDYSPTSDIDLAIEGGKNWPKLKAYFEEQGLTLLPIDLVCLEEAEMALKERILKEGCVLYEK
ncbi:MAG: hypothetical protein A3G32_08865 [Deltaproteobacteria bacterium RIFCSPLOWO2_12_FULL_40_28]|nr:MAG: hypothetical protein A3C45_01565 [Deltaproteobacteria bacterium RIFCSPHIGHO2_02_FULL_40_28]OGQ21012.1 MAG: hypothetical protein A3E27_04230 [Deltaproteobacteria bacterium RIFCSPHIGHO2_12_FULL_40_32]OGQ39413.1 MAG: hypothetical protein A3I69_05590 [Deltaproteobacteria bacterium RIFCSPLOWO2_02_FULL_40_36]OGQ54694.1 MAG: hypothetical protein A3G32_08865 [Deltaproteobacteria bacterium RIFCSPLOWO2_12_FULL_40_28]